MTTRLTSIVVATALVASSRTASAQQPPRPNETPRAVTLSLTEYNRLIDLANRPPQRPTPPPVPAVLSSADLRVRVDRANAHGTFTLAGNVLRTGVSTVNLLSGGTVLDATVAGRPLPLIADGNTNAALLPGPGPFAVSLEWGAPVTFSPGRAAFVLPVPPSGTARATLDVPGDQADVHISAGLITRRTTANGRTTAEITLDPGSSTEVWWSMRDSAPVAAAREARSLADVFTLVTIGDSDVRMVALIDVSVVQGDPRTFEVRLPGGYELTGVTGSSLDTLEPRDQSVILTVTNPTLRRHQFLVSLERQHDGGSFALETTFVTLPNVQRERGEVAIEGVGTLELTAPERDGMHRMDVRELNSALRSLARLPVLSAYRYQRGAAVAGLTLDVKRFADAGVLAAVADHAVATTLVTSEGRALTEVALIIKNRAQPFLKVTLPAGASIVSVEIAGESAKPALGTDGTRVPLLRPGFRPSGPYKVTFVYLHAGTPFAKKGEMEMSLPRMDIPVSILQWEVFAPERYAIRAVDGNVIERHTLGIPGSGLGAGYGGGTGGGTYRTAAGIAPGAIRGRVLDTEGSPVPGASVVIDGAGGYRSKVTADQSGAFGFDSVPSGSVTVSAGQPGFVAERTSFIFDQQPQEMDFTLAVGPLSESLTVQTSMSSVQMRSRDEAKQQLAPSQNVINLQRRAAGVLPVRVDVPRAGTSYQFVKPLVVDQAAVVSFRYKRR